MMKSTKFELEGCIFTFFGLIQLVLLTASELHTFFANMFPVSGMSVAPSYGDILLLFANLVLVNIPAFVMIGIGICGFKFAKEEETK